MPVKKITVASLKNLAPGQTVWDSEIKGFGCRRQKDSKVFILKFREGKGRTARQRLYTIGKLGSPWTPDTARTEARKVLGSVAGGENPAEDRQKQKKAKNVDEAFEIFMEDTRRKKKRAERTRIEYQRLYDTLVKKHIGRHRVQDVTQADIEKLHNNLSHTAAQANRLIAVLSAFFSWCIKHKHRLDGVNPCRNVDKYKEEARERFLSEQELFALSEALNWYDREYAFLKEMPHKKNKTGQTAANTITPYATAAIRLLIFTGARRSEILTLQWSNVDFKNRLIRLQTSKTGQKTIYLSAPALQILSEIPRIEDNPYVICGYKEKSCLVNIKDPWDRIRQKATLNLWCENKKLSALVSKTQKSLPKDARIDDVYGAVINTAQKQEISLPKGLMDVRLHDLRHNYASTAVVAGHHLKVIGSLLGHAETKTTERYAHLANDPLQTANEAISAKILQTMTGETIKNNVVNLRS